MVCAAAVLAVSQVSFAQVAPQLPAARVDTTYPSSSRQIAVPAGGDFQAALDRAVPGDTIVLQAGASYQGEFVLPAKSGSGWIIIRTSAPDSALPPPGRRITPAYAPVLPKLIARGPAPAIRTAPGANHYRFVGVEFTIAPGQALNYGLVQLGDGAQTSLSQVPYNLVFDRVYVHGDGYCDLRRGFSLNSAYTAIIDSYVSDVHERGADTQAIAGWNGPGPFKIVNNYLEAAGENIMFGGVDPKIPNLVPSDIEIRGNHLTKQLAWRDSAWTVKNLFELKNARRVLVEGNVMEYNWQAAQNGYSILLTPRNQEGSAPWVMVKDITFVNNVFSGLASGVSVLARDDMRPSDLTERIAFRHNLFLDVNAARWGGLGRAFQILEGVLDLTIENNTMFQSGEIIMASGQPNYRFTYRNNLSPNNTYGIAGQNTFGSSTLTLQTFFPAATFGGSVFIAGNASLYPSGNHFPTSVDAVGFVNYSGGDYRLSASSPYKGRGSDGRDPGADVAVVMAHAGNARNGISPDGSGGYVPPPPTTSPAPAPAPAPGSSNPVITISAPANGATVSGIVTIRADVSDSDGVSGVVFRLNGGANVSDETAPYEVQWDTRNFGDAAYEISATAWDRLGNAGIAAPISVRVANASAPPPPTSGSGSAPSITITAPGAGSTVSARVMIRANVTDPDGVAGVVFRLNGGSNVSDEVAPYEVEWDTTRFGDGTYEITATAWDRLGNAGLASPVSVRVSNAAPAPAPPTSSSPGVPVVTITSPAAGTVVSGDTFLRATASDADGISGVVFRLNGEMSVSDETAPFEVPWKTRDFANGTYVISATAWDRLGNAGVAQTVTVTVANGTTAPAPSPGAGAVQWTGLVNASVVGADLRKTSGCGGCADAGAYSVQTVGSGGYVEFTVRETWAHQAIGLNPDNYSTTVDDIDYAIQLWPGGGVDIRERGGYRAETRAAAGDVFRIAVSGTSVTYAKNGVMFYRSELPPQGTLRVDTALMTAGATFSGVTVAQ